MAKKAIDATFIRNWTDRGGDFRFFKHLKVIENRRLDLALLSLDRLLDYSNSIANLNHNRLNRWPRQGHTKSNRLFSITLRCLKNQKSKEYRMFFFFSNTNLTNLIKRLFTIDFISFDFLSLYTNIAKSGPLHICKQIWCRISIRNHRYQCVFSTC